ncbi:DUF1643 domain-containing protein [Acidisoma silvae]|uniref:DUF1643 domain-containing protein n=1 Tax=Acidisoma silvae TaxID=2802396 RepID=A0A964E140_9PROT|nr:DUF1643 domain-containing protein [Acidisoma silvae]MCB8877817.1 DUF1643 domain-containing protein [Acidisoma silvae]
MASSTTLIPKAVHSPGGKTSIPLPGHVIGRAKFSKCGRYRQELWRTWGETDRYALFIGMNPSTASHLVDDPTCLREWKRAERMGLCGYAKANVLDVRITDSKTLHRLDYSPVSKANLPAILRLASKAEIIVACWGRLHSSLAHYTEGVETALRNNGHTLLCLGQNADGSPKHPLYLRADAELVQYSR